LGLWLFLFLKINVDFGSSLTRRSMWVGYSQPISFVIHGSSRQETLSPYLLNRGCKSHADKDHLAAIVLGRVGAVWSSCCISRCL